MTDVRVWQLIAGALFVALLIKDHLFRRASRAWVVTLSEIVRDLSVPIQSGRIECHVRVPLRTPHLGCTQVFNRPHDLTERT